MTIANAFAELKAHTQQLIAKVEAGAAVELQHLKDLFIKVEDVGSHIVQGGRTLVTVDVGNMTAADAKSMVEDLLSKAQAVVTEVKYDAEQTLVKAEAEVKSVEASLGITQ